MNKRAQGGLSINVIIVALIALVVLVVLIAIFTGQMGKFVSLFTSAGDAAKTCSEQGGELKTMGELEENKCPGDMTEIKSSDAAAQSMKCCKVLTE